MTCLKVCVLSNDTEQSVEARRDLVGILRAEGLLTQDVPAEDTDIIVTIGGDGATLDAIHKYDFPDVPVVGVNTGHLGFFQEIHPEELESFIKDLKSGHYSTQELTTVEAEITDSRGKVTKLTGLNEVVIRGADTGSSHFDISIGGSIIERFSGDGILIATSAGSTAYNYSLGGSIVDPGLKLLQVTPIAPMNTTAYRSFTSSILLPGDVEIGIVPEYTKKEITYIIIDGFENEFREVKRIKAALSDRTLKIIRFEGYDFWSKVKSKFL